MPKFIDLTGTKKERLTVIERVNDITKGRPMYRCICDCGKEKILSAGSLRSVKVKSCGCLHKELRTVHGLYGSAEYKILRGIIQRCEDVKSINYKYYGGKGIKVSQEWRNNPEQFIRDMGERPSPFHSIDRKDPNKDYTPENCVWATDVEQNRNRGHQYRSKSGVSGVQWEKKLGRWIVRLKINGKSLYFGTYVDLNDAIEARKEAELKYWGKSS